MPFFDIVGASSLSSAALPTILQRLPAVTPANAASVTLRPRPVQVAPITQTLPGPAGAGAFYAVGTVDGNTGKALSGAGFTSTRTGVGMYRISYRVAPDPGSFSILFGLRAPFSGGVPYVTSVTPTYFEVEARNPYSGRNYDTSFSFAMVRG